MELDDDYDKLKTTLQTNCSLLEQGLFKLGYESRSDRMHGVYRLFFESFKGVEAVLKCIDITAYSQAATILRNAIEQVSIIKVLVDHQEVIDEYNDFAQRRFDLITEKPNALENFEEKFKNRLNKKSKKIEYLDFGWLEKLDPNKNSIEDIIELADFKDLISWRKYYNNFVHSSLSFTDLAIKGVRFLIENIIYISAVIYDHCVCMLHNLNGYNFYVNNINMAFNYIGAFEEITVRNRAKK